MSSTRTISETPEIVPSPQWGGRGQRPRSYTISCRRKRDKGTGSYMSFREIVGPRMIYIGGCKILEYRGAAGGNCSGQILESCGVDPSTSKEVSRRPYQRQKMKGGGPPIPRNDADWQKNQYQT